MPEIADRVERIKSLLIKYKNVILIIWLVLSMVLLVIGVVLLSTSKTKSEIEESIIDYTDCQKFDLNNKINTSCRHFLEENEDNTNKKCTCYIQTHLDLKGNVTLYFELPSFDQSATNYTKSRDDNQLRGIFTEPPSANCKPYEYDNGNPIVPCGAIADSMLDDHVFEVKLRNTEGNAIAVDLLHNGMLSPKDKAPFHNPINLIRALQNFSRPLHWRRYIYELDPTNEDNNGFQNEYFISWMRTDRKRKHIARVNHSTDPMFKDGLPKGKYQIGIQYRLSPPGYKGRKLLIFATEPKITGDTSSHTDGGVLLGFGVVMLAAGVLYILILGKQYLDKKRHKEELKMKSSDKDATSPSPLLSDNSDTYNTSPSVRQT